MLEVMVATCVITIGTLGFLAAMAGTIQMDSQSNESVVGMNAAKDKLDEIWNQAEVDYSTLYSTYQGQTFDVAGLEPNPALESVGLVTIYNNEATAKAILDLSLDIDLDRDGIANENEDIAADDMAFIPVRVHIEWMTPFGVRSHDLDTFVYNRED